jgi:hypothetical protein
MATSKATTKTTSKASGKIGVISGHECYSVDEFLDRTGLGKWAYKSARRAGLKTVRVGKLVFVRGIDWHDFLGKRATEGSGLP